MSEPETPLELDRVRAESPVDRVVWFDEVDSTNTAALAAAAACGEGAVLFISDNQRAGRGRRGADWWSTRGALTFSLLVDKPPLAPHEAPKVSLAVGLAVCRAVEQFLPSSAVRLKWPNDVFVDGRKACGVLVESPADAPSRLVIGIGLNVNNSLADAPDDLQQTATSLLDALGRPASAPLDRTDVLIACLNRVVEALTETVSDPAGMAREIGRRSLLTGLRVRVESPGSVVEGRCRGIAADGALVVETDAGQTPCYGGVVARFG